MTWTRDTYACTLRPGIIFTKIFSFYAKQLTYRVLFRWVRPTILQWNFRISSLTRRRFLFPILFFAYQMYSCCFHTNCLAKWYLVLRLLIERACWDYVGVGRMATVSSNVFNVGQSQMLKAISIIIHFVYSSYLRKLTGHKLHLLDIRAWAFFLDVGEFFFYCSERAR